MKITSLMISRNNTKVTRKYIFGSNLLSLYFLYIFFNRIKRKELLII